MKKIYKYNLELIHTQTIRIPSGFKLLCVKTQNDTSHIWALVDPKAKLVDLKVQIVGTGHDATRIKKSEYLGTIFLYNKTFVGHVFIY